MIGKATQLIMKLAAIAQAGDDQIYEVKLYKAPRTKSQNSYYWSLLSKVADAHRMNKTELHNRMLRDYGQVLKVKDTVALAYLPDTDEAEKQALEMETLHLKPTSQVQQDKNGIMRRTYVILKGSSDYNTAEMSALVDGIVQEAKQLGIETMTPAELEQIRVVERRAEERKKRRAS